MKSVSMDVMGHMLWLTLAYLLCRPSTSSFAIEVNKLGYETSWGTNYSQIDASWIDSITVYQLDALLTGRGDELTTDDYDSGYDDTSYLYENSPGWSASGFGGIVPVGGLFSNSYGDITNLGKCIKADSDIQGKGIFIEINFTAGNEFEIYRVEVAFGTDYGDPVYDADDQTELNALPYYSTDESTNSVPYKGMFAFMTDIDTDTEVKLASTTGFITPAIDSSRGNTPWAEYVGWQTDLPTSEDDCPLVDRLTYFIGDANYVFRNEEWYVCELMIYGKRVTQAPTTSPTPQPVAPTNFPTHVPTGIPTGDPTSFPTTQPTVDMCPNFNVTQPCCADQGGSEFVNYSYQIWNSTSGSAIDSFVPLDEENTTCTVYYVNSTCCGEDLGANLTSTKTAGGVCVHVFYLRFCDFVMFPVSKYGQYFMDSVHRQ